MIINDLRLVDTTSANKPISTIETIASLSINFSSISGTTSYICLQISFLWYIPYNIIIIIISSTTIKFGAISVDVATRHYGHIQLLFFYGFL